jgi:hypothetical protein
MICLAIIVDETVSIIGIKGKNKLRECLMPMTLIDPYSYRCPKGHITKTELYEVKGLEIFFGIEMVPDR